MSVRLRFLLRLRDLLDEVIQGAAKDLSENEVHSHTRTNDRLKSASLNTCGSEAYMQVPIDVSRINEEVGAGYGNGKVLNDFPFPTSYAKNLSATQISFPLNSIVFHNQSPGFDNFDLSSLNANSAGVES